MHSNVTCKIVVGFTLRGPPCIFHYDACRTLCGKFADEEIRTNEPIEADKPLEEIRQEPYTLPTGFCWDSLDIDNPIVVCILAENYKF